MVGRVGDDQVAVAAEPVGEEVIEHAALLVAKTRVLSTPKPNRGDVIGEHPLQKAKRPRPLDLDLPHMRHVEHPRMRPHRRVLLPDPLVLHRHLPAGEGNDLRPELNMPLVEGCASERVGHARQRIEDLCQAHRERGRDATDVYLEELYVIPGAPPRQGRRLLKQQ